MLDHVFTDAISALREAFEGAFLERQAFEEHFQVDVLLGDLTWETSYGLPGEGLPPRVVAAHHLRLADVEPDVVPPLVRRTRCSRRRRRSRWRSSSGCSAWRTNRTPAAVLDVLPASSPPIGDEVLERAGPTVEIGLRRRHVARRPEFAIEITYEGLYELAEETLADGSSGLLDEHFGALGGWISSMLVRLGDLPLSYLPPEEEP